VQVPQRGAGIGAQLLDQAGTQEPVVLQRLGGAPGPVQGQHVLPGDAFVQRVPGGPCRQLRQQFGGLPECEPGVDEVALHGETLLVQPVAFLGGPVAAKTVQRLAPPQRQRLGVEPHGLLRGVGEVPCPVAQPPELVQIDRGPVGHQHVPAGPV
jgi:hypothetical protein